MKNFIFLLAFLVCSFKVSSQTLAEYNFNNSSLVASNVDASVTATDMTYTFQFCDLYGTTVLFSPVATSPFDSTQYAQVIITAKPTNSVFVSGINLDFMLRGGLDPSYIPYDFYVYGSTDGFTNSTLLLHEHNESGTMNGVWRTRFIPYPTMLSPSSNLAIRLYAGNGFGNVRQMWLDNVHILGRMSPLPITLTSFDAYNVSEGVKIDWSTASEQNNHYFVIERSEDMRQWQTIDVVAGAGNSQQTLYYSTLDRSVVSGWYYYRLSQVDYDSQSEVFDNQVVPVYVTGPRKVLFPNPASVGEIVHIPPNSHVFDSMGRLLQSGMSTFVPLTSGLYLVGTERLIVK